MSSKGKRTMALKFKVQGLGKIEDAEINLSPLTVITGPNGTGKSFFTKMIYSIFRMLEDSSIFSEMNEHQLELKKCFEKIKSKPDEISEIQYQAVKDLVEKLNGFNEFIEHSTTEDSITVERFSTFLNESFDIVKIIIPEFDHHSVIWKKEPPIYKNTALGELIYSSLLMFMCMSDAKFSYEFLVQNTLPDELKENFQVSNINELVNYKKKSFSVSLDNHFTLHSSSEKLSIDIEQENINFIRKRPKSVFFESPAYWRVRDALVAAKMKSGDEYLSGVPKYFFDLDSDLRKKSKAESELIGIYDTIRSEISGEFIFEGNEISFKDNSFDQKISKNLVSFGMTNLGMLNALIKNNVIKKGSYVFIDEPETNLHPDWQVLIIRSLVALSKAGVNVIITTHSTEILKYIEVTFSKIKAEEGKDKVKELLSINYLDTDGTSLEFDSECPIEQTKEALSELSSPFFNLYMEGN